jgi:hypothetical protein
MPDEQKNIENELPVQPESKKAQIPLELRIAIWTGITSIAVASITFLGTVIASGFDNFITKPRERNTQLILKVLEKEKDLEILNRVVFLIDSGLLEGEVYWDVNKPLNKQKAEIFLGKKLMWAAQYEGAGFQALLDEKLEKAKDYFSKSWSYYPEYHKVQEINTLINKLIKNGGTINDWGKEVYCPIVKEHSWGMPDLLKTQMTEKGKCKQ